VIPAQKTHWHKACLDAKLDTRHIPNCNIVPIYEDGDGRAVQSKTLGQGYDSIVPKKLALMDLIPNYALNNLANLIGISLGKSEEEWENTIIHMHRRTLDKVASRLKYKRLPNTENTPRGE